MKKINIIEQNNAKKLVAAFDDNTRLKLVFVVQE